MAAHSSPDDAWVSFHGNVYDLTTLIAKNEGPLVQPLVKVAGTDISHWFTAAWTKADHDTVTGRELSKKDISIKMHIDPVTNLRRPYVPRVGLCIRVAFDRVPDFERRVQPSSNL